MKKNYLFLTLLTVSSAYLSAQNLLIVNGGLFGNPYERVNVQVFDPSTNNSRTIDTIHTSSVQEILLDGDYAFVAAQDSIIKYDLIAETRIAGAGFNGPSTKAMALYNNYLLVGNWYGKNSYNLYIYDKNTLALVDSIQEITKGVSSIIVKDSIAFIAQNSSTANYEDTLGYLSLIHLPSLQHFTDLHPSNYSGDIGQMLVYDSSIYALNPASNTILGFNSLQDSTPLIHQLQQDLEVISTSQYALYEDTLFVKWDGKLGSFNLKSGLVQDSVVIDTVVTAFALDTVRKQFYVTQTDYFSYNRGGVYSYEGVKTGNLPVGFSPEVACMHYFTTTSINEYAFAEKLKYSLYPNPASENLRIEVQDSNNPTSVKILDITGKVVLEKILLSREASLDIANLKPGVYIVQLQSGVYSGSSKLIKR